MSALMRLESAVPAMVQFRAAVPRRVGWDVLHEDLGAVLPSDFCVLAEAYPVLVFEDFLRLELPQPGRESSYVVAHRQAAEILQDWGEEGDAAGYVPFPEPGGLLLWGWSYSGDYFYWRTESESPDGWPVVVMGANGDWSEYAMGAVDFLAAVYRRDFTIPGMPGSFPSDNPNVVAP
ncbi:hypothetical protein [Glycomyces dulcitolivorans]|uniref:hypothetical protein n=1 Tax=Glycomyces dulcitolivorans TaxID=2200759 RepID=UPI0018E5429A|nr:hypothetical protein [Glycomyces dulcitolivorans]